MTSDLKKIFLPQNRRVMPGMIAANLISVQPMTSSVGQIFSVKTFWSPKTILFKDWEAIVTNMHIHHTAVRPFMRENDPEPNEKYRPWLEEHIGEQGVTWNWRIHGVDGNSLAIDFATEEHATLFELTWL